MRPREQGVGVLRIYAHQQPALTAGRDGHVSADQKGEATEHPLLGDIGFAGDQLADAIGEVFVVRHGANMVAQGLGSRKSDRSWISRTGQRRHPAGTSVLSALDTDHRPMSLDV